MPYVRNQRVLVELASHIIMKAGKKPSAWKEAKFLEYSKEGWAWIEFRTSIGWSRRSFPLEKVRPLNE